MNGHPIEVRELVRRYGDVTAVDGLTFSVAAGEIYGFLGPNGAGKTTTIRVLVGLLPPTSGRVLVGGHDPYQEPLAARAALGWADQATTLYGDLTGEENLRLVGALAGLGRAEAVRRARELLELVGLADRGRELVRRYSGGMQRRLHLAMAMVHRPRVLLLDEPLVGVDPQARALLVELIRGLARDGCAVLLTTHDMDDAERLCHRVGIVDHGRLLAEGTVEELRARLGERDVIRLSGRFDPAAPPTPPADLGVEVLGCTESELWLASPAGGETVPGVLAALAAAGIEVRRVTVERPTLETLFLELTGRELRE